MRRGLLIALPALLSGCVFPNAVQRMGVDYNSAVAGMVNELTLLNIVRAKEQLPLHYTSVSRLNGSLTLKGSASFGDEIRGLETTKTTSASPSTVTKTGVDTLKPTIGGEVSTGSNFDVASFCGTPKVTSSNSTSPPDLCDRYRRFRSRRLSRWGPLARCAPSQNWPLPILTGPSHHE